MDGKNMVTQDFMIDTSTKINIVVKKVQKKLFTALNLFSIAVIIKSNKSMDSAIELQIGA